MSGIRKGMTYNQRRAYFSDDRGPNETPQGMLNRLARPSKTSTPIKGFASPAQANQNMSGVSLAPSPRTSQFDKLDELDDLMLKTKTRQQERIKQNRRLGKWQSHTKDGKRLQHTPGLVQTGPRGGRFYIAENGTKVYVN